MEVREMWIIYRNESKAYALRACWNKYEQKHTHRAAFLRIALY